MDARASPPHSKATSLPLPGSQSEISTQLSEEGRCQHSTELALRPLFPNCCMPSPHGCCRGGLRPPVPGAEGGLGAGCPAGASLLQGLPCSGLLCEGTAKSHQHRRPEPPRPGASWHPQTPTWARSLGSVSDSCHNPVPQFPPSSSPTSPRSPMGLSLPTRPPAPASLSHRPLHLSAPLPLPKQPASGPLPQS